MSVLQVSSRCKYGILATVELAKVFKSGSLTISQIASRQHIPARFLEAILRQLKLAGIVDSIRGKQGGYFLKVSPKVVTMGELFRLLEIQERSEQETHTEGSFLNNIFKQASTAYVESLSEVTLEQFVDNVSKQKSTIDYAI